MSASCTRPTLSPVSERYRMELDLVAPLPQRALPEGFAWVPWEERLLEVHADVKYQCFRNEFDGVVFPNLCNRAGSRG